MIIDSMRGIVSGGDENTLAADNSAAENGVIGAPDTADLTATGKFSQVSRLEFDVS